MRSRNMEHPREQWTYSKNVACDIEPDHKLHHCNNQLNDYTYIEQTRRQT